MRRRIHNWMVWKFTIFLAKVDGQPHSVDLIPDKMGNVWMSYSGRTGGNGAR